MKKKFKYQERKGLPGGPNEISTYLTGVFSIDGYKRNSPDVNNPYNIIPSGNITMKGVDFPVMGTDNLGNSQMMMPGYDYVFPGNAVFEVPMAQGGIEVPNEILNWQDNAEWFNNRAVFSDDPRYNDLIKKLTLAGTHGFNPSTGTLHKLETPVSVSPDIAYNVNKGTVQSKRNNSNVETTRSKDTVPVQISNEDWWNPSFYFQTPSGTANAQDFAGQTVYMSPEEAEAYNKEMVRYNMNKVYQDSKIWRAPGAAYLAAFAGPGTFAAGENAGLGLTNTIGSYWNAPLTVGSRTIPGVTVGNTVNSAFAADFLANRAPEIPGQIAREEYGDAALNVGFGALDLVGAGALNSLKSLKNIKTSSPIINRIRYGKATPQNFGEALVGHPIRDYDDILIRPYLSQDEVIANIGGAHSYSGTVRRLNKFLKPIADVADDYTALINSRAADLRSPEGFRRLVNQERGYLQQLDGFPASELDTQAKINARARINEFDLFASPGGTLNSEAQILLNSGKLTPESAKPLIGESYLFGNAFYASPNSQMRLDGWGKTYSPKTGFLLKKNQSILGGKAMPGRTGMSSTYSHTPMMSHELAHGLQRGRVLPIDQELRNIIPRSNLNIADRSNYKYFRSGSDLQEPSAFANELRESMLQRGLINSRYEFITPAKLKAAQLSFYNKPMGVYAPNRDTRLINQGVRGDFLSTTRLLDFMEPSANNYRRLANALNKLPATTAGLGLGAAAYSQGEYKKGGQLPTYQTRGETPLTRDEVFNIPRTVRYENGKMVLQDKPIYDGMLDEVTVTPTTASEIAFEEWWRNKATGGLDPIYPVFDALTMGLRAPLTKGAKAVQGALTSEKTLGALARSPYVPKFTKPGLIKNYKSKFPNVDLRGTGTGNYNKLGVNELGLGVDDFGSLTNYERSAISQVNQTQPADDVFNTFVQRYGDFNTDDALANQLADFSRRNPRTKFEINLGTDVTPSKRMQEIFNDPELNVHNVFSYESSGPMNFVNKWGNESRRFYDSSARNAAGEFEKNLRSYGQQGFYAANVPMGKPVKQALTYNKDGRVFDYVTETLPVSDFVVNKGLMNPDVIGNFSRYRGAGDMANQHNFLLGITNSPSVIISGNKGFAGLKGGNKIRENVGGLITPTGGKAIPSHNNKVVPLLKQEFNLSKPFEGTFMKSPGILETYYNSKGQASPYTNFPDILDIDDLFITGKSNYAKGGSLPKAQEGNGEKHTVASGETFYGIANKYKLDKQDLIDANPGLNIESIKAGQTINLPVIEKMEPVSISAADSKREPTSWTDYINPFNWGVTDRDDDGTFNQAFRAARNSGEDEFMWYGTRYNTNLKPTLDKVEVEEVSNEVEADKETGPFGNYSVTPELLYKQAFVESTLDPKAKNEKGFMGLAQIGDDLITDYKNKNRIQVVDPFDPQQNHDVQAWSMNELYNATFINKPGSTNENRLLKALASYNWGRGNVKALLEKQKAKGADIYTDTSWTSELPKETREYIDMILYDGVTEKRPLVQENFKNALVDSTYKDIRDLYIYKSGGEKNQFQIYKDYVEGVYDGTEMEKAAEKIYDKLNRVYYREAKKQGMKVPNYIMTNVIKQIDN